MTAFRSAMASRWAAGPTINGMVRLVLLPHHEAVKPKEVAMPKRNVPRPAAVYGIDIGKNISTLSVSEAMACRSRRLVSDATRCCSSSSGPTIIGMEWCAGSQCLARKLQALGHKVRLIPAQFVKPYVKSNKTDIIDAEAIAEAATRPTMRFASLKSEEQADLQALHRVRDQMIGTRTRPINQMRAFCLEYGIALRPLCVPPLLPSLILIDASSHLGCRVARRLSRTNQTTFRQRCVSCSQICSPIYANWNNALVTSHARSKL